MILAEGAIIREFVMVSNWRFLISDYLVDVVTLVNQKVFALLCPKKETDMGLQCHLSEMQQCFHLEILRLYLKGSKSIFSIPNVASDLNVKWDLTNYLLSAEEDEREETAMNLEERSLASFTNGNTSTSSIHSPHFKNFLRTWFIASPVHQSSFTLFRLKKFNVYT